MYITDNNADNIAGFWTMTCKSKKGKDCELLLRNISVDCIKGPIPWTLCWFMLFWAKSAHFRVRPCLSGYSFYFLLKVWRRKTFSSAECKKVKCPNLLEKIPWNFLLNFVGILSEILQLYSCAALWKSEKPPRLQSVAPICCSNLLLQSVALQLRSSVKKWKAPQAPICWTKWSACRSAVPLLSFCSPL